MKQLKNYSSDDENVQEQVELQSIDQEYDLKSIKIQLIIVRRRPKKKNKKKVSLWKLPMGRIFLRWLGLW